MVKIFSDDPIKKIKRSHILSKAKGMFTNASEIAKAINEMGANPTLKNYLAVGTITMSKLIKKNSVDPAADNDYERLYISGFENPIVRVISEHPNARKVVCGDDVLHVTQLHGEVFICKNPGKEGGRVFYHVRKDEEDQMKKIFAVLGRVFWETYGNKIELVPGKRYYDANIRTWEVNDHLVSDQTLEVFGRLKKFLNAGHNRSILLYGPPGTGKSCMTRYISGNLNWPTLYIDASQMKYLDSETLSNALTMLCPYIVIVDDLDRVYSVSSVLSTIDRVRQKVRLLMVTINDKKSLDAAVKRAGRFDEVELVKRVAEPSDIVSDLSDEQYEKIDTWPISFIDELRIRKEVLGDEMDIDEEIEKLDLRVLENRVEIKKDLRSILIGEEQEEEKEDEKS